MARNPSSIIVSALFAVLCGGHAASAQLYCSNPPPKSVCPEGYVLLDCCKECDFSICIDKTKPACDCKDYCKLSFCRPGPTEKPKCDTCVKDFPGCFLFTTLDVTYGDDNGFCSDPTNNAVLVKFIIDEADCSAELKSFDWEVCDKGTDVDYQLVSETNPSGVAAILCFRVTSGPGNLTVVGTVDPSGDCGPYWIEATANVPAYCVGDVNLDGLVDGVDQALVLANWGACPSSNLCTTCCLGDCDRSGSVNGTDLGIVFGNWGTCP